MHLRIKVYSISFVEPRRLNPTYSFTDSLISNTPVLLNLIVYVLFVDLIAALRLFLCKNQTNIFTKYQTL